MKVAWSSVGGTDCLRVSGASALDGLSETELAQHVRVYPSEQVTTTLPAQAVAGSYVHDGEDVCFVPRFPFVAGAEYTALVHRLGAPAFDLEDFDRLTLARARDDATPTTRVVAVHPSSGEVPRNLLRVYVHFSAPMSEGGLGRHVRVCDAGSGEPLDGAFLPMDPELWDRSRQRATVLFDPARIKRGLAPHREAGYPLREGATVDVVVDRELRDADGRPLARGTVHRYRVIGDVRTRVDPADWDVDPVAAGTRAPLVVRFDRRLDHALLQHCIVVTAPDGSVVPGEADVGDGERSWAFTPARPWPAARHVLAVDPMLEDTAGNSVRRVFDRDLDDDSQSPITVDRVAVEFLPA
jgi:hypothetical protein